MGRVRCLLVSAGLVFSMGCFSLLTKISHLSSTKVVDETIHMVEADKGADLLATQALKYGFLKKETSFNFSIQHIEESFYKHVESTELVCSEAERIGLEPNSWDICIQTPYRPKNESCLVYSFRFDKGWATEKEFADKYGCKTRVYNPSIARAGNINIDSNNLYLNPMTIQSGNGILMISTAKYDARTFTDFRDGNGESNKVIDYLMLDINSGNIIHQRGIIDTFIFNKALDTVKQFALTLNIQLSSKMISISSLLDSFTQYSGILDKLKRVGFRKWHIRPLPTCQYTSAITQKVRYFCYHFVFLNTNVLFRDIGKSENEYAILPPMSWLNLNEGQAEKQFETFVHRLHYECKNPKRVGNAADGGWQLCLDPQYVLQAPCTVYSFGINNDWTFDDFVSKNYGCTVKAFDPSMNVGDHQRSSLVSFYARGLGGKAEINPSGWRMNNFLGFLNELGDTEKTIDVLKIDIEYSEWKALDAMLLDNSLKYVKQLVFEIHTDEVLHNSRPTPIAQYENFYNKLKALEDRGFRKWYVHNNQWGIYSSHRTGNRVSCCYEMSYVNINFTKPLGNTNGVIHVSIA